MKNLGFVLFTVLMALPSFAQKVGGTFNLRLSADPTTLHPIMSTDTYASDVQGYVLDGLMTVNPDTYELEPGLAEKMEVKKDGMEYVFTLREGAKFHDGKPVTIEDVKFSFDAIFMDDFKAFNLRPYYENVDKVEIVDARTIRFLIKKKYFLNERFIGGLTVIPKHIYSDTKAKLNKTLVGSGPYAFESWERSKRISLKRNPDWWGWKLPQFKNRYNFDKVVFRIVKEDSVAFEMLKKGDIDFMELTAEQYELKAKGPEWGKKVFKVKTENKSPKGYGYIAWNLREEIFKDVKVRRALSMLVNRPLMNEKFRFNMSLLQAGPIYDTSEYASKNVKPIGFDPKKALELLKEAGWDDKDKNGVLEKEVKGQKKEFKITVMTASEDSMKYLTMFKEDAKKVGVQIETKVVEWNSFIKLIDEFKFEGMALSWGGGTVDMDPKQIWHSSSAVSGGSNFIGYSNPEADKLIDQARETMDKKKRIEIIRKFYEIVAADAPYSFLFTPKFVLYAHSGKVKKPKDTFVYDIGTAYWWAE